MIEYKKAQKILLNSKIKILKPDWIDKADKNI